RGGRSSRTRGSRFFFRQGLLEGAGADAQDDIADRELGGPEGTGAGGDQGSGDAQEVRAGGVGQAIGQLHGLGFLLGGKRFLHDTLRDNDGGSLRNSRSCS